MAFFIIIYSILSQNFKTIRTLTDGCKRFKDIFLLIDVHIMIKCMFRLVSTNPTFPPVNIKFDQSNVEVL